MTQLKPLHLWVVELPEGVKNVSKGGLYLPVDKDWIFHFTTQTATEQDWAGVVPVQNDDYTGVWYFDFITKEYTHQRAATAGHSLLTANGLPVEKNYAILGLKK